MITTSPKVIHGYIYLLLHYVLLLCYSFWGGYLVKFGTEVKSGENSIILTEVMGASSYPSSIKCTDITSNQNCSSHEITHSQSNCCTFPDSIAYSFTYTTVPTKATPSPTTAPTKASPSPTTPLPTQVCFAISDEKACKKTSGCKCASASRQRGHKISSLSLSSSL